MPIDDFMDPWAAIRKLQDDVRRLQRSNPLENSSITDGILRIIRGTLRVEGGGTLIVEGTFSVDGTTTVTGTLTVTGPWSLEGDGTITGATSITGDVTIEGDVDVTGAGRIKIGNITLDPSTAGGQINFSDGRRIDAGSGFLGIYDGSRFVVFNSSGVAINGGGPTLLVGADGIYATGLSTVAQSLVPGSFPDAIVYYSGEFRRVVP